jgi:putative lipoprotein
MRTNWIYVPEYRGPLRKTFLLDKNYRRALEKHEREYNIRFVLFLIGLALCVFLSGCAAKEPIVRTEYKNVYIPIKCEVKIPVKPKFDPNNMQSALELAKYFQACEVLLKECAGVGD